MNAPFPMPPRLALVVPLGGTIAYPRASVTDRCDFRCVYCMAEDQHFLPKKDVLSLEELDRLCSAFVERGVRRLRLTGGEPLVRKNMMSLVRSLSRHLPAGTLDELTLTPTVAPYPVRRRPRLQCGGSTFQWTRSIRPSSARSRAGAIWTR